MEIVPQLSGLQQSWDLLKAQDEQKNDLVQSLFDIIQDLKTKLSEAEGELLDKKTVVKSLRGEIDAAEDGVKALQREKNKHIFAMVLIDGDCMPFQDDLVRQGLEGGKKVASLLKQSLHEILVSKGPELPAHLEIVCRVYANLTGMGKLYKDIDLLSDVASFHEFVRGFNMADPMFDYVDAGDGKECSDEKMKATFKHSLADVHCRHIVFGASADNGYARSLEPVVQDGEVAGRITLLEGPPFAYELAKIKGSFRTVTLEQVFRGQKLVNLKRRVSFRTTPPASPSVDYAKAAANAAPAALPTVDREPTPPAVPRADVNKILRNAKGDRVDSILKYSPRDFQDMKVRKLCNVFHLLGHCYYDNKYRPCQHKHGETLSPGKLEALRAVARLAPCTFGLKCDDPNCIAGHRCPRENCQERNCKFSEMHNVDCKVVVA